MIFRAPWMRGRSLRIGTMSILALCFLSCSLLAQEREPETRRLRRSLRHKLEPMSESQFAPDATRSRQIRHEGWSGLA